MVGVCIISFGINLGGQNTVMEHVFATLKAECLDILQIEIASWKLHTF